MLLNIEYIFHLIMYFISEARLCIKGFSERKSVLFLLLFSYIRLNKSFYLLFITLAARANPSWWSCSSSRFRGGWKSLLADGGSWAGRILLAAAALVSSVPLRRRHWSRSFFISSSFFFVAASRTNLSAASLSALFPSLATFNRNSFPSAIAMACRLRASLNCAASNSLLLATNCCWVLGSVALMLDEVLDDVGVLLADANGAAAGLAFLIGSLLLPFLSAPVLERGDGDAARFVLCKGRPLLDNGTWKKTFILVQLFSKLYFMYAKLKFFKVSNI